MKTKPFSYFKKAKFKNWNPDLYGWYFGWILPIKASKYFKIWWTPDKFNWSYIYLLEEHCKKYKKIWGRDYIIYKLVNNL